MPTTPTIVNPKKMKPPAKKSMTSNTNKPPFDRNKLWFSNVASNLRIADTYRCDVDKTCEESQQTHDAGDDPTLDIGHGIVDCCDDTAT